MRFEIFFKLIFIFLLFTGVIILNPDKSYAVNEINKKLQLKKNHSSLLSFNEHIIRYRIINEKAFNVEILPDIYNDRHEMLIEPLEQSKTNLFVWTKKHLYNFEIEYDNYEKNKAKFWNFNRNTESFFSKEPSILGKVEIDKPPALSRQYKLLDSKFEIDLPPGLNENNGGIN